MESSIQRLLKMKKYMFWINSLTPIEKQFNEDWNTPIHLKNDSLKYESSFDLWFLIMTFNLCFYHQLWVKWAHIHIGNSSGHLDKLIHDSRNVCGYLALNEMHTKLTSLIICLVNDNLTSASTWSKKKQYYI